MRVLSVVAAVSHYPEQSVRSSLDWIHCFHWWWTKHLETAGAGTGKRVLPLCFLSLGRQGEPLPSGILYLTCLPERVELSISSNRSCLGVHWERKFTGKSKSHLYYWARTQLVFSALILFRFMKPEFCIIITAAATTTESESFLEQYNFMKISVNIPGPWEGPDIQQSKPSYQFVAGYA